MIEIAEGSAPKTSSANNNRSSSEIIKMGKNQEEIERAGCEYENKHQLLQDDGYDSVCIMPFYSPEYGFGVDKIIDVGFEKFKVSKIFDKENRLKLLLNQYIEWKGRDIRSDIARWYFNTIKLSPESIKKIWYPDLDISTPDVTKWESLNDPHIYSSVEIMSHPILRNRTGENGNFSYNGSFLFASKEWEVDITCQFNLKSYPMDSQKCRFEQTSFWYMLFLSPGDNMGLWNYDSNGFYVTINYTGAMIDFEDPYQNSVNGTTVFGFDITLERMVQPFLYMYYLPCMAIVLVSQISFIIPLSSIPGRVALVVTQFLTLTNIFIHQTVRFMHFRVMHI